MPSRIGFIGAGRMGGAVARRLATGGYEVHVYDPAPDALARCTQAGAVPADSARAAAKGAPVVCTSLPLPEDVLTTWTELAPALEAGAIAVDLSTIDPDTAEDVHETLARQGNPFVTCALGKMPAAAEEGRIPLFVGGQASAVEQLRPIFERIGERVYDFGNPRAAATFKLISNLIGMTNVALLAEGYALARRAGIDSELFRAALADTGAHSFQSEVRLPWMAEGDYRARFGMALAAKDMRLAVNAAARWEIPTPVAAQGLCQLITASARGYSGEDVAAVAKLLLPEDSE